MTTLKPVSIALIGAGRIGTSHAEILKHRVSGAELVAIIDPVQSAAQKLAGRLGVDKVYDSAEVAFANPDIEAVVITSPKQFHTDLVLKALEAGKAVFVEKPMATTLADADCIIAEVNKTGAVVQVGFNRRWDLAFADGKKAIEEGAIGEPQLLRSLTRDPGPYSNDPFKVPLWTIFIETLIHDFDTLLWLNQCAKPIEVYAIAGTLIRPDAKPNGHLDTALVTIRFDNGSIATAEASFSALYGYDVRGEVFGSRGMVTMGDVSRSSMKLFKASGISAATWRADTDLFIDGYTNEFKRFVEAIRGEKQHGANAQDARNALEIALAAIEAYKNNAPVKLQSSARIS